MSTNIRLQEDDLCYRSLEDHSRGNHGGNGASNGLGASKYQSSHAEVIAVNFECLLAICGRFGNTDFSNHHLLRGVVLYHLAAEVCSSSYFVFSRVVQSVVVVRLAAPGNSEVHASKLSIFIRYRLSDNPVI